MTKSAPGARYRTQWAAQFFAAAELTRRGYLVSFTLGNAPEVDLQVMSPGGRHFLIDVKGLASKNFWLIRERPAREGLFYVLVYLPPAPEPPQFFILSSETAMAEAATLRLKTLAAGKTWAESGAGLNWGTARLFSDRWNLLPE